MSEPIVTVSGVTGFLGWHVALAFRDAGWRVRGLVRPGTTKPLPPDVERAEASLEPDALARALQGSSVFVHAAGVTSARREVDFEAVNVQGTRAAVAAANAAGAHIILISSQAAAGSATSDRPSREGDAPHPLNAYGRSKLAAERVVSSTARVPWTILRPSAIYGPRDRQFLPLFRMAARGWFLMPASPTMPFTLAYVADVARAVVAAADRPAAGGRLLFIGHPEPVTTEHVLRTLAETFERSYRPMRVPGGLVSALSWVGELALRAGADPPLHRARLAELRAPGFVCATDHARDALGLTAAVGLVEGCARTARWYRDHGWV